MRNFYYCPPSNNLWTIEFRVHRDTNQTTSNDSYSQSADVQSLYNNIITANQNYRSKIGTDWRVDVSKAKDNSGLTSSGFLRGFSAINNIFLAQEVNVDGNEITDNGVVSNDISQHGGFLTQGRVILSRNSGSLSCSVDFLVSNWSIADILIDPWIAAVAQNGLIKADGPELTADIFITYYAASAPRINAKETRAVEMKPQKVIKLFSAYPISRDNVTESSYDFDKAGAYQSNVVRFAFDDYSITYLL